LYDTLEGPLTELDIIKKENSREASDIRQKKMNHEMSNAVSFVIRQKTMNHEMFNAIWIYI
jgi:hypothetical protein